MIRTILVALDGSERAPAVLSVAADVAQGPRATMLLLRVIHVPQAFPAAASYGAEDDPLPAEMERKALDALASLAAAEPRARESRLLARPGLPEWRTIIETADEVRADLIVLGSHGYSGMDRILGTTANKVVNMARRNVLVVHGSGNQ